MNELDTQIPNRNITINLSDKVSVNSNYLRLNNKPSINGVELIGNMQSSDLNLLTNNLDTYSQVDIKSASKDDFLLLTSDEGTTQKMKLGEITSHLFSTQNTISGDMEIGSYVFLLKEEN